MPTPSDSKKFITVKEMGPRDGLQNEPVPLSLSHKVALIEQLATAGVKFIECGAFVSPRRVPQMAETEAVFKAISRRQDVCYSALVPNERGLEAALESKVSEIAVFTAASESFCQHNIQCSIAQSFERFKPVVAKARAAGIKVRGYLSCVLGCPYEGAIAPERVAHFSAQLIELGCYEVSLGDTIGVGTPSSAQAMYRAVLKVLDSSQTALHFHDTFGRALANTWACMTLGATTVDTAVAGLGGCPYAPGASGNLATENLVDCLHQSGYDTGIDLNALLATGRFITKALNRQVSSQVALAYQGKK